MKISFIATVYNEEKTIENFLSSLFSQTLPPDEIIIVDGNSSDQTVTKIKKQISKSKNFKENFKIIIKNGNRSIGRNEAIKHATGDVIVCSDAGNILDKEWIKNITKPFLNKTVQIVAGYYKGRGKTVFQKCLMPYVLVMEDKVDSKSFLPSTRSMAFKKTLWKKLAGFPEQFDHNEDYVFAKRLEKINAKIVFAKSAIVYWIPRKNIKEAFIMFFRFALGDSEAGIIRHNVLLLIGRYVIGLLLLFFILRYKSILTLALLFFLLISYIIWSINKNYRYVMDYRAFYFLPLLQFTADFAVISGTLIGLIKTKNFYLLWIGIYFVCSIFIFLSFRFIRSIFPIPSIGEKEIIGYIQYFGYPFYFDTILFFTFLFLPVISYYITKLLKYGK